MTRFFGKVLLLSLLGLGVVLGGDEVPSAFTLSTKFDRVVMVRLKNGTDVLQGLQDAVAKEKIKNAVFLNGFGSVTSYHVHVVENSVLPPKDAFLKQVSPYDLLSVSGLVIGGRVHAHLTLAGLDKTLGGHLEPGTKVFTFTTITLGILSDSADLSKFDDFRWH